MVPVVLGRTPSPWLVQYGNGKRPESADRDVVAVYLAAQNPYCGESVGRRMWLRGDGNLSPLGTRVSSWRPEREPKSAQGCREKGCRS